MKINNLEGEIQNPILRFIWENRIMMSIIIAELLILIYALLIKFSGTF